MTEMPSASFVMHGARDALATGLAHIEQHVKGIERAVVENPGLAFDLARTLVEIVCRTILSERNVAFSEEDDLPKLFKTASSNVAFLPPSASGEAETRESLRRTLNGLSTTIQGICELRNKCGFASHGSGSPRPVLESAQALLAAQAADTIVGFLHRVHRQDRAPLPSLRALYEDNAEFNDWVDEQYEMVQIFGIKFRPSEVLFEMEPESYRVYLTEFDVGGEDNETNEEPVGPQETTS